MTFTQYSINYHFESYKDVVTEAMHYGCCPPFIDEYVPIKVSYKCHGKRCETTWVEPDGDMVFDCNVCGKIMHFHPVDKTLLKKVTKEWQKY